VLGGARNGKARSAGLRFPGFEPSLDRSVAIGDATVPRPATTPARPCLLRACRQAGAEVDPVGVVRAWLPLLWPRGNVDAGCFMPVRARLRFPACGWLDTAPEGQAPADPLLPERSSAAALQPEAARAYLRAVAQ